MRGAAVRRPTRVERALLGGSVVGFVVLVALRMGSRGVGVADDPTTHWLGQAHAPGSGLIWRASSAVTSAYLPFVALASAVLLGCLALPVTRRRAAIGLGVLVTASVGAQALKLALRPLLGEQAATLPSGHAAAVTAASVALVALAPARQRLLATCVLSFVATAGALGVVVAQWHRPGDAFASLAVVTATTVVAGLACPRRPAGAAGADGERSRFEHAPDTEIFVAALVGAATCVVTFQGWGSGLTGHTIAPALGGLVTRWGIALAVASLMWSATRVEPGSPSGLN